nr:MAG TPA: hypothetical protein [Caudoviricetes sp.]
MAEYFERETLLERAEYDNNYRLIIPAEAIKDAPAADVAPVVRCENCTSGIMSDDNKYIICCRLGVGMELDGFCSHGERKIT